MVLAVLFVLSAAVARAAVCGDGEITSPCVCLGEYRTGGSCYNNGQTWSPPMTNCWAPVAAGDCPCNNSNRAGCNLATCTYDMTYGEMCEMDGPLPSGHNLSDGRNPQHLNNCPGWFDVFSFTCGSPPEPEEQCDQNHI